MWSQDYADDDDIDDKGEDDDYLGQKEQVPFTFKEAGGNTYEARLPEQRRFSGTTTAMS